MATNTFYVQGQIDASGDFAACSYFYDKAATQPFSGATFRIPTNSGICLIGEADGSGLVLVGAVYKTIGLPPALNNSNYCPSNDEAFISVPMPLTEVVTKGVVLLFADRVSVAALYPSSDPQVINEFP